MTTHYAATKTRDGPEPDADWIYELDAPLDRDEAGWLVGLCSLAPLVDPAPWPPHEDPDAPDARALSGGVAAELQLLRWQGGLFNATSDARGGVAWRRA